MTDSTNTTRDESGRAGKEARPQDGSQGAAPGAELDTEDLALVDHLEDDGKSEEDLWNELEAKDAAASGAEAPDKSAAGDEPAAGDEGDDGAGDAAADAGDEGDPEKGAAAPDKAQAGKAAQAAADLWANATPEQKAEIERLRAERDRLEQSDRSNRGRVSALQRQIDGQRKPAADGQGNGKPGAQGKKPAAFQTEKGKKFREEYPEAAEPVAEELETLRGEVHELKEQATAREHSEYIAEQVETLESKVSDWTRIKTTQRAEFETWLKDQPQYVKDVVLKTNAREIVDADAAADVIGRFDAFRSAKGEKPNGGKPPGPSGDNAGQGKTGTGLSGKRQRQLLSAAGSRSGGGSVATGIPDNEEDPEKLWNAMEREDQERERRVAR